jgi:hypothetical protein
MGDAGMFAGIWYAFGTVSRPLARQWRGAVAETAILLRPSLTTDYAKFLGAAL